MIVGGWAGSTIGLSCIDDLDASSNETSIIWPKPFEIGKWYKIRLRVEPDKIMAWLDDETIIDVVTTGKKIGLRGDTTLCTPMGVCSFMTHAEIKDFKFHLIDASSERAPATEAQTLGSSDKDGSEQ